MNEIRQSIVSVLAYHERTKHHFQRYAAGPDGLDWADQPEPFRRFDGCSTVALPKPGADCPVRYADLNGVEAVPVQPVTLENVGLLLELAFGLSAWKQFGSDRWALRCNPSSGNLHPTEVYLVDGGTSLLSAGVYHYLSHDHVLEQRCRFDGGKSVSGLYLALTSIHWREAWKYGERAYRYCQHDVGHALAAARYAAGVLGWSLQLIAECGDSELEILLGLDRAGDFVDHEEESPDLICRICSEEANFVSQDLSELAATASQADWQGKARRLSKFHHNHWPIIDQVTLAARKRSCEVKVYQPEFRPSIGKASNELASTIIRRRRSAQRFDAKTFMPLADFNRLLEAVLPERRLPFDLWRWPAAVHLLIFVHRVEGLPPGVYAFPRGIENQRRLQAAMRPEFSWQSVEGSGVDSWPLYALIKANCRRAAKSVSCHQDIAGDGAFSVAMLSEFESALEAGAWHYRRLFWETGMIGQALYLEAEAVGMRGTGIGCFFDDGMHELLGLKDCQWQSLYHFTVGQPLDDLRLQTLPPYSHL